MGSKLLKANERGISSVLKSLTDWFPTGCISLLGLQGGGIAESQISASSVRYAVMGLQRWGPELARLHNKGLVNAWSAAAHDRNPWIQVTQHYVIQEVMKC